MFYFLTSKQEIFTGLALQSFLARFQADSLHHQAVVRLYTSVDPTGLTLAEYSPLTSFYNAVLSRTSQAIRDRATAANLRGPRAPIEFECQYSLSRIFKAECELVGLVADQVRRLQAQKDFDLESCFREIDISSTGFISEAALCQFLS